MRYQELPEATEEITSFLLAFNYRGALIINILAANKQLKKKSSNFSLLFVLIIETSDINDMLLCISHKDHAVV